MAKHPVIVIRIGSALLSLRHWPPDYLIVLMLVLLR